MAARQVYEPNINPVITRPTSAPTNTYVRAENSDAQQVARALAEFEPKLAGLANQLGDSYVKDKRAEGEQAARIHAETALKAGDLTRLGELPMQDNPYFMAGYQEEQGRVAAGLWQSDFKAASEADPVLQESTNLSDFDKAAGSHLTDWLSKTGEVRDQAFEKGFGHMKDQYLSMERLAFANGIEGKLGKRSDEALFSLVKRSITNDWGREGITPDDIAEDVDIMVQAQVNRGRPEGKARTAAVEAIVSAAREAGPDRGLQILELLKKAKGEGGKGTLNDQSYGAKALLAARQDLILEGHQEADRLRQEKDRAKAQRIEDISSGGLKLMQEKGPSANLEKYLQENPDAPPETVSRLRALQAQFNDLSYTTNQEVYNGLFHRILDKQENESEVTVSEIVEKGRNRNLRPEDTYKLVQMLEGEKEKKGRKKKDPLDERAEAYFDREYKNIGEVFKDKFGFVPRENAFRMRNSRASLQDAWNVYKETKREEIEKMSETQLNQWFVDKADTIVKNQSSQLQGDLRFQPPKSPTLQDRETANTPTKLPPQQLLSSQDTKDWSLGKTESIKRIMRSNNIPLDQMKAFVLDQLRLQAEAAKPKNP